MFQFVVTIFLDVKKTIIHWEYFIPQHNIGNQASFFLNDAKDVDYVKHIKKKLKEIVFLSCITSQNTIHHNSFFFCFFFNSSLKFILFEIGFHNLLWFFLCGYPSLLTRVVGLEKKLKEMVFLLCTTSKNTIYFNNIFFFFLNIFFYFIIQPQENTIHCNNIFFFFLNNFFISSFNI
jgi:uncharacterized protein YhbP (UPF0306 family)